MPRRQNAGQTYDKYNKLCENVGKRETSPNLISEENKNRLKTGNACYRSAQKHFLSFHLLTGN
jgi:hypothetical protein